MTKWSYSKIIALFLILSLSIPSLVSAKTESFDYVAENTNYYTLQLDDTTSSVQPSLHRIAIANPSYYLKDQLYKFTLKCDKDRFNFDTGKYYGSTTFTNEYMNGTIEYEIVGDDLIVTYTFSNYDAYTLTGFTEFYLDFNEEDINNLSIKTYSSYYYDTNIDFTGIIGLYMSQPDNIFSTLGSSTVKITYSKTSKDEFHNIYEYNFTDEDVYFNITKTVDGVEYESNWTIYNRTMSQIYTDGGLNTNNISLKFDLTHLPLRIEAIDIYNNTWTDTISCDNCITIYGRAFNASSGQPLSDVHVSFTSKSTGSEYTSD
ncbi:MAG: hypothetical protein DRO11_05110, partial [Methanobacteriota archaeon]